MIYEFSSIFPLPFSIATSLQVPPLFPTMSFFYSALGMRGSDSRGSVRQPMVEREVVPIEDSSSEEVPHEVSDNGSSPFERLISFDNVGEGSYELHTGIESPTTPTED